MLNSRCRCGKNYVLPKSSAGKTIICKFCGADVQFELPPPSPVPPAAVLPVIEPRGNPEKTSSPASKNVSVMSANEISPSPYSPAVSPQTEDTGEYTLLEDDVLANSENTGSAKTETSAFTFADEEEPVSVQDDSEQESADNEYYTLSDEELSAMPADAAQTEDAPAAAKNAASSRRLIIFFLVILLIAAALGMYYFWFMKNG